MPARQQAMNHLVNYLANHPRLASLSDPNIALVADQAHAPLVEQLYVVMSQQFAAYEQYIITDTDSLAPAMQALQQADAGLVFFNHQASEGDNPVFDMITALAEADLAKSDTRRFFVFQNVNPVFDALFAEPLAYYTDLHAKLTDRLTKTERVRLVANDSELSFTSCGLPQWSSAVGLAYSLYPGEIANYAQDLSGTITFTGIMLSVLPFAERYGLDSQVTLHIEEAKLISFETEDQQLREDLSFYFDRSPQNRIVSEIGIGTNGGLKQLQPVNCMGQERFAGFHLGFGGAGEKERYESIHLDFIFDCPEIWTDEQCLFTDGKFQLA